MPAKLGAVRITANFAANLEAIEVFLAAAGAPKAYLALLDELVAAVVPNLERYPEMGRPFLERSTQSVETEEKVRSLKARVGPRSLREYLVGDYLILYAVGRRTVDLLSIKHYRQLSFDLSACWQ